MSAAKAKQELEYEVSRLRLVEQVGADKVATAVVREELERIVETFDQEDTDDEW